MHRAAVGALLTLATVLGTCLAHAESTLVVLARSATGGPGATEVLNRARGELAADGFKVLLADAMPPSGRVAALAQRGQEYDAAVAAGLFVADDASSIELYLVDEFTGRVLVRRLDVQPNSPEQAPEVLARRTVDLLRASLLDFLVESIRSAVSEGHRLRQTASVAEAPGQTSQSHWGIEAGLGVLGSFDGIAPSIAPLARVRFAVNHAFQIRLTGAGFGTQSRVQASSGTGTATVEQGIAVLECVGQFWRSRWIRPYVSLGAGTYYVAVNGSGMSPYPGRRSSQFAAAADAGLGAATPVGSHFELLLEAHALLTAPGIAIRFLEVDAARAGRPSILGTISLAGWI